MDETLLHTERLPLDQYPSDEYDHILDIKSIAQNGEDHIDVSFLF